jgi:hypothetical protein
LIRTFDAQFLAIHNRSNGLIEAVPGPSLYWQPKASEALFPVNSCGEFILRSAAAVEQTFGGITTRLWDDPFEWTLPEAMPTNAHILEYLGEVELTRLRGFGFFASDEDLKREIRAPEILKPIAEVLLETISRASYFQGRAASTLSMIDGAAVPRF